MKHLHFDVELNGFYGAYWACAGGSDCAVITMIGDDPEDRLARSAVKWLCGCGVNVLTMSPAKKDYGHHNYPLERVETAISWLKANGNRKIGVAGASTTGTLALTAAAMFPDITLTIAMTPSDFVWQGFMQGKKDGCKEWPIEGESLFSYKGKPLPYMPFCYQHPDYWRIISEESKRTGNMIASRKLFDDSEAAHPITEEEFIKVENICGKLFLVGAEDDALWDTAKYIRRMEKRLAEKPHSCEVEAVVGGDGKIEAIAAASILAKTTRDAGMSNLHLCYPQYGFDRHMGYPTALHLRALREHGPSPVHRRSFSPVRQLVLL